MTDTFSMTPEEFRKYSNEREFRDLSNIEKFDHVWTRIPHEKKAELIEYFKDKTIEESLESEQGKYIFRDYKEFGYVVLNSQFIIEQIKFYAE